MHYLHYDAPETILYGDLKSPNGYNFISTLRSTDINMKLFTVLSFSGEVVKVRTKFGCTASYVLKHMNMIRSVIVAVQNVFYITHATRTAAAQTFVNIIKQLPSYICSFLMIHKNLTLLVMFTHLAYCFGKW